MPGTYAAGVQTVTVYRKDTKETATIQYTYETSNTVQNLEITSISPNSGEELTSKQVTIIGKGFVYGGNFKVLIGTTELTIVSATSTKIIAYIPNTLMTGKYPLKVINKDGTTNVLIDAYECTASPAKPTPNVTSILPQSGVANTSYELKVEGSNFRGTTKASTVVFNGQTVNFTTNSDTQLVFYAPKLPAGTYDIIITNSFGKAITISYVVN